MSAVMWRIVHHQLSCGRYDDLDAAARAQAWQDNEWYCIGVEVTTDEGRQWWPHEFKDNGNLFTLAIDRAEREADERYRTVRAEQPVIATVQIVPPAEVEDRTPVTIAWPRSQQDLDDALTEWRAAVGFDRVHQGMPPRT